MENKILTLKIVYCLKIDISITIKSKSFGPSNKREVSGAMHQNTNSNAIK